MVNTKEISGKHSFWRRVKNEALNRPILGWRKNKYSRVGLRWLEARVS